MNIENLYIHLYTTSINWFMIKANHFAIDKTNNVRSFRWLIIMGMLFMSVYIQIIKYSLKNTQPAFSYVFTRGRHSSPHLWSCRRTKWWRPTVSSASRPLIAFLLVDCGFFHSTIKVGLHLNISSSFIWKTNSFVLRFHVQQRTDLALRMK